MDKDVREKFPIFQALEEAGIDTFEDLMQMTFEDIDGLTYHYGIFGRYKKGSKKGQPKLKEVRKRAPALQQ